MLISDSLHWQCHGDKSLPPLVLLHGFLGSAADWQDYVGYLSHQCYCICIDLPGHGGSRAVSLPTPGLMPCAELILTLLAQLGIERFHLQGYSLGGRVALHIAKRAPHALLSLHLESCHPGLLSADERATRLAADHLWAQQLLSQPLADFLAAWYQQAVFTDLSTAQRQALIAKRSQNDAAALHHCYCSTSLGLQQNMRAVPASLDCHFYAGSDDAKFLALAQQWQQSAGPTCHLISHAGHNIHQAAPRALAHKVLTHIYQGS
ncbi:2-succinyl-6-hydroxy-2,4-cyclohexadiene-1-carboxylate synthase [Shewanella sp. NIFS-20-20]|uniref:2-succinyl-6-hydroxy-2, 4-cyclohexadiene-1-carboxylate synthase n=1 Tax=Shewanella sp. NIFS-20-20 TaxID=2853806 RepID=UPI001C44DA71|nr:2-succinyl-6-hydroxy-2,4-cyclohexadiene-1-carboxylate synthase [Shewanella sp. NIFS-20-20]MBV7316315.1 2-succinyl-6-hydroxy-2,4-cyclohexadiene-1-carboxylate synthase [Shewanella sp. NIFS-20-20]